MMNIDFAVRAVKAELDKWNEDQLKELLGNKHERLGIFEGDETEGEMEAGQGVGLIKHIPLVKDLFTQLLMEFETAKTTLTTMEHGCN